MKKLVIAFALLMVLTGGTISILKTLKVGPFAEPETASVVEEAPPPVVDKRPEFITLEVVRVPIYDGDRVVTTLELMLTLETTQEYQAKVNDLKMKIANAMLLELPDFLPRLMKQEGQLDVATLKKRLELITRRVAGEGTVDQVLVQSVKEVH